MIPETFLTKVGPDEYEGARKYFSLPDECESARKYFSLQSSSSLSLHNFMTAKDETEYSPLSSRSLAWRVCCSCAHVCSGSRLQCSRLFVYLCTCFPSRHDNSQIDVQKGLDTKLIDVQDDCGDWCFHGCADAERYRCDFNQMLLVSKATGRERKIRLASLQSGPSVRVAVFDKENKMPFAHQHLRPMKVNKQMTGRIHSVGTDSIIFADKPHGGVPVNKFMDSLTFRSLPLPCAVASETMPGFLKTLVVGIENKDIKWGSHDEVVPLACAGARFVLFLGSENCVNTIACAMQEFLDKLKANSTASQTPKHEFWQELPSHVCLEVARAALDFAVYVAKAGVGEGHMAHGFCIIVGDGGPNGLMAFDDDGHPLVGEPSMHNAFHDYEIQVQSILSEAARACGDQRYVVKEFTQDGCVIIDGASGKFVCGNYIVLNISKGARGGGARHRSASAVAQQAGNCFVIKCSEENSAQGRAVFDIFIGKSHWKGEF